MRYIFLFLTLFCCYGLQAQEVRTIKLKQKAVVYKPRNFKIVKVVDDREDTTNIGFMRAGLLNKHVTIDLDGGVAGALTRFLQANVAWDETAPSAELHITKLNISEKPNTLNEQADIAIAVAFYEDGNKVVEYSGSAFVKTTIDASAYIEMLIREKIEELLKQFDKWRGENAGAAEVQVTVEIPKQSDNEDLIYYDRSVPLTLQDFKGEPDDMSLGAAATSSGLGMRYAHQRVGLSILLKVYVFAYFDRSKSWCKATGKNAKTLAHEQGHFDICAIKCNELADAIRKYSFSKDNYSKELDALLRQYDKELGKQQQLYDHETEHGVNRPKQKAWEEDIRKKLRD